jgi:hypothetical protein
VKKATMGWVWVKVEVDLHDGLVRNMDLVFGIKYGIKNSTTGNSPSVVTPTTKLAIFNRIVKRLTRSTRKWVKMKTVGQEIGGSSLSPKDHIEVRGHDPMIAGRASPQMTNPLSTIFRVSPFFPSPISPFLLMLVFFSSLLGSSPYSFII